MCCAEFIVKYILFFANLAFSLFGLALIGLGVAVIYQVSDILELIPVDINTIPIAIIVLGSIIFAIAFFGCCGAIKEGRCLLIMYAICMGILAALKIWLAVVIFQNLNNVQETVGGWINDAFSKNDLRQPFNAMEIAFKCCGTSGPDSYTQMSLPIPPSCCSAPVNNVCPRDDSYGGCTTRMISYFETFGDAIGAVIIVVICVEIVAMVFGLFLSNAIKYKQRQRY